MSNDRAYIDRYVHEILRSTQHVARGRQYPCITISKRYRGTGRNVRCSPWAGDLLNLQDASHDVPLTYKIIVQEISRSMIIKEMVPLVVPHTRKERAVFHVVVR